MVRFIVDLILDLVRVVHAEVSRVVTGGLSLSWTCEASGSLKELEGVQRGLEMSCGFGDESFEEVSTMVKNQIYSSKSVFIELIGIARRCKTEQEAWKSISVINLSLSVKLCTKNGFH